MKEAIGGLSLFQIVVVFLLVFTGIMCLTINHSKAFGVKDEIINIIETESPINNTKLNPTVVDRIVTLLGEAGYRITGECPNNNWVGYSRTGEEVSNNSAAFCIRVTNVESAYHAHIEEKCQNGKCDVTYDDYPIMLYYDVLVFYQLDIPFIKDIMKLNLNGSTKVLFG